MSTRSVRGSARGSARAHGQLVLGRVTHSRPRRHRAPGRPARWRGWLLGGGVDVTLTKVGGCSSPRGAFRKPRGAGFWGIITAPAGEGLKVAVREARRMGRRRFRASAAARVRVGLSPHSARTSRPPSPPPGPPRRPCPGPSAPCGGPRPSCRRAPRRRLPRPAGSRIQHVAGLNQLVPEKQAQPRGGRHGQVADAGDMRESCPWSRPVRQPEGRLLWQSVRALSRARSPSAFRMTLPLTNVKNIRWSAAVHV